MNENPQVIVVGGGASGLTAAIVAAQNGATVTVLEQNENPGAYSKEASEYQIVHHQLHDWR